MMRAYERSAAARFNAVSRRGALASLVAVTASVALGGGARARPADGLHVLVAPTGASITLERAFASGDLAAAAPNAELSVFGATRRVAGRHRRRAGAAFLDFPHVPANLANRGLPIRLLALLGSGHLYVVTAGGGVSPRSRTSPAGRFSLSSATTCPISCFAPARRWRGSTPTPISNFSYVQSSMEAAQMLAAGRRRNDDGALRADSDGGDRDGGERGPRRCARADQFSAGVERASAAAGACPMVGVAVQTSLVDESPELIEALGEGAAGREGLGARQPGRRRRSRRKDDGHESAPVFIKALPAINLDYRSAADGAPRSRGFLFDASSPTRPTRWQVNCPADDFLSARVRARGQRSETLWTGVGVRGGARRVGARPRDLRAVRAAGGAGGGARARDGLLSRRDSGARACLDRVASL